MTEHPARCAQCKAWVEEARRGCAVPTCYACLPPPPAWTYVYPLGAGKWLHVPPPLLARKGPKGEPS